MIELECICYAVYKSNSNKNEMEIKQSTKKKDKTRRIGRLS